MMPEVSGYPLERIKELFEKKKWYMVGCTQNKPLRIKDEAALGDDVPQLGMQVENPIDSKTVEDGDEKDLDKDIIGKDYGNNTIIRTKTAEE